MVFSTQSPQLSNNDYDIVHVGAGPVGLWTAIQTKIHNPRLNILLLDKHANEGYVRTQRLKIYSSSFRGIPASEKCEAAAALANLIKEYKKQKMVEIQDIENKLLEIAKSQGIVIQHQNVTKPKNLKNQFPNARVIIGSDGYHSIVRKKIFTADESIDEKLQHIIQVQYKVKGKTKKLSSFKESAMMKYQGAFVKESVKTHIGENENYSEVTIRFFVNPETYNQLPGANLKNPWKLNDPRFPLELKNKISLWMRTRGKLEDEELVGNDGEVKITRIQLSSYANRTAVKQDKTKEDLTWMLLGDAYSGVPFFRSINKGFLEGTKAAKALAHCNDLEKSAPKISKIWLWLSSLVKGHEGRLNDQFKSYASYVRVSFIKEHIVAKIKSWAITFFGWALRFSRWITPTFIMKAVSNKLLRLEEEDWALLDLNDKRRTMIDEFIFSTVQ